MICNNCEKPLPWGCCNVHDDSDECPMVKRIDIAWQVGRALLDNLSDRRGIGSELESCEYSQQAEIMETLGNIAIKTIASAVIK